MRGERGEMYTKEYWDSYYEGSRRVGWDVGYVSTPLKEYFDQITDKSLKILVPGAGSGWEAEYLYKAGFLNTYILDFSMEAIRRFRERCPEFPQNQIITDDFFSHDKKYDLLVEQTFFTSFPVSYRQQFADKIQSLLHTGGKYMGITFNHHFNLDAPPFGATEEEFRELFSPYFDFKIFNTATNSIKPRRGREVFFVLVKRNC